MKIYDNDFDWAEFDRDIERLKESSQKARVNSAKELTELRSMLSLALIWVPEKAEDAPVETRKALAHLWESVNRYKESRSIKK